MGATGGFSLTNCGPFDRALARAGLPSSERPRQWLRALALASLAWLPLLLLALLRPHADSHAAVSFLEDLSTHVRFLLAVPLLILVEPVIGRRTRMVADEFVDSGLVTPGERARFDALLRQAGRALDSALAEAVVAALALLFVVVAFRALGADGVAFWFERPAAGGAARLTAAGWWYAAASWLPPFLLLRWLWRYGVWSWLLGRLARFDLQVVATHPDQAGGLGFVGFGHASFSGIGFAVSALVSAAIGTRILEEGASLVHFQWPIAVFVALATVLGIAPLAVFWRPLRAAKETGLLAYGGFASRYVQAFHAQWLREGAARSPLDARDDIGPLADIGQAYERADRMRIVPISLRTVLSYGSATLLPMLPLLLTIMPLRELVKLLMQAMI